MCIPELFNGQDFTNSTITDEMCLSNRHSAHVDRHVASLPEVVGPPQQMEKSVFDTPIIESSTLNDHCEKKQVALGKSQDFTYQVEDIILFQKILQGFEPSRQPGTASSRIEIHHGGIDSLDSLLLNGKDTLLISPSCGKGICDCIHFVGSVRSQLKPCAFGSWFVSHYEAFSEADVYVLYGAYYGFPILDVNLVDSYECLNYSSITEGEGYTQMSSRIDNELKSGKISVCTSKPKCIHALGALFKADGKIRPITDCKRPLHKSINNAMDTSCYTFTYSNIDNVCAFLNRNDYMCVVDIDNAYRSVNILPAHVPFQAFTWIGKNGIKTVYQDHCLCFGIKSAPYIFTQVGNFMVKCLDLLHISRVVNYIDDFLVCEADYTSCNASLQRFLKLLTSFGFAYNEAKLLSPSMTIKYLGILVDSNYMTLCLPQAKLEKLLDIIMLFESKTWSSKKDIQMLAGNLSHASTIVKAGRTFSRRVFNLIKYFPEGKNKIFLSNVFRADIKWWLAFARMFNGVGRIITTEKIDIVLYTDASGSGFGGITNDMTCYFLGTWENVIPFTCPHVIPSPRYLSIKESISQKELWPILIACQQYGKSWTGLHVCIYSDNQAVCSMISSGRSRELNTMSMLREIFWVSFIYNFTVTCRYIKGLDNVHADYLSRISCLSQNNIVNNSLFANLSYCCRRSILQASRQIEEP